MWEGLVAIFVAIKGAFDLINPWSQYWVNKRTADDSAKKAAQVKMDDAAQKGATDAFLDARSDKHNAD